MTWYGVAPEADVRVEVRSLAPRAARATVTIDGRSVEVRLGVDGARHLYRVSHMIALASIVLLVTRGSLPWWAAVGGIVLFLGGLKAAAGIRDDAPRAVLTKSIEMTIGLQAVGSILLFVAALFAH